MEELLKKFFYKIISDPLQTSSNLSLQIETIKDLLILLKNEQIISIPDWIMTLTLFKLKNMLKQDEYFIEPKEVILKCTETDKNGKKEILKDVMHYCPLFQTVATVLKSDKKSFDKLKSDRNELLSSSSKTLLLYKLIKLQGLSDATIGQLGSLVVS